MDKRGHGLGAVLNLDVVSFLTARPWATSVSCSAWSSFFTFNHAAVLDLHRVNLVPDLLWTKLKTRSARAK